MPLATVKFPLKILRVKSFMVQDEIPKKKIWKYILQNPNFQRKCIMAFSGILTHRKYL